MVPAYSVTLPADLLRGTSAVVAEAVDEAVAARDGVGLRREAHGLSGVPPAQVSPRTGSRPGASAVAVVVERALQRRDRLRAEELVQRGGR